MGDKKYRFIISGGGTGGHIFPALSIANEIKRRYPDADILFIGANDRMEMEKVPAAGYRIVGLPVSGFNRKNLLKNVSVLLKLWKSMRKASNLLKDWKPDIAIGVGGYVSGPILKEAQKQGIPTLIQEQNSYAGVTNKLLAKNVGAVCVAYEGMEKFFPADKIELTGNPIRQNLLECTLTKEEARKKFDLDPSRPTILIVGGSLGARTINNSIEAALQRLADSDVQVIWQTGKFYDESAKKAMENIKAPNIKQMAFIPNMDEAYRAADLVVSRAGASSISEIQCLGLPAVLIPSPNVAEDHQTKNALALVNREAAVMVKDIDCPDMLIDTMLNLVKQEDKLAKLSVNVKKMALTDSAKKIVDKVIEIIESKNK